jgi:L-seryl-tRNA(Ser) seleniumtransferase
MSGIYEELGIRPLINARGTHTRLGGWLMDPEVVDAMRAASRAYVVLEELQEKASEIICRATGAEAGMVTGGAAAGLLLGTAACLTRGDPGRIEQLPDTTGFPAEVVMFRAHRNGYDHSIRAAGAKIIDAGYGHGTHAYQLEAAIGPETAMVAYVVAPWAAKGALSLPETCEIAHRHGLPVLVDAAAMLPPAENLRRFIAEGADLVTYSGGKGIGGPQSSGILAGRADLIQAAMQNGSPNHSIGRPAKAAKEDIVGLIVALERYLQRDHAAEMARWEQQARFLIVKLGDFPGVEANYLFDPPEHPSPRVELIFDAGESGVHAPELIRALEDGDPRVFLLEWNGPSARPNSALINVHTLQEGEEQLLANVLSAAIRTTLAGSRPATTATTVAE